MNFLEKYSLFLGQKTSQVTVKNYLTDLRHFIKWFESEYDKPFDPLLIDKQILDAYWQAYLSPTDNSIPLSASTLERHLSSLRKFFQFLKTERYINQSPFQKQTNNVLKNQDKWLTKEFKNSLILDKASRLTIKNYIIDLKQFISWIEKVTQDPYQWEIIQQNHFDQINEAIVREYAKRLLEEKKLSAVSVNRKLASIRKYSRFLLYKGVLKNEVPKFTETVLSSTQKYDLPNNSHKTDNYFLESLSKKSELEIYNKIYSRFPPLRLLQKSTELALGSFDYLVASPLASLIEYLEYIGWAARGKPIFVSSQIQKEKKQNITNPGILSIQSIPKEFYAPFGISTKNFPLHKKIYFHIKHSRPKWYKRYHSYAIAHYLHFSILVIFMSAIGYGWYQSFIKTPQEQSQLFAFSNPASPPRVLSFQGRLTDASDNPISTSTQIKFSIYNSETASGSAQLWEETQSITPDTDGLFSTMLGKTSAISQSLFATSSSLWLGITVGSDSELIPRQQLATVAYASNAETLQGLLPITQSGAGTTNVVLALDSSGNLTIGGTAKPTFQASGGQFKLSGQPLVLSTNTGSNGDIQLAPDGSGKIDAQKPLINTGSTNPSGITGAVEVNDLFAIHATSSAQAVLNVNQTSTGNLISASQNGTARFIIKNKGGAFFEGDVGLNVQSPAARLDVGGDASASGNLTLYGGSRGIQTTSNNSLTIGGSSTGNIFILPRNGSGFLGIGTSSPNNLLEVLSTSSPQVRFAYNTSNYTTVSVSSAGSTTIDANGSSAGFTFSDAVTASNGLTLTTGALSLTGTSGSIALTGFGTTSLTSTTTTGNIITLADSSFAVADSATGNLINLTFTNGSANTSGTAITTGLNIAGTNSAAGSGGTMDTYAIRVQDIAGTAGAGTQNNYGIRIGNQGQASTETSYGIYIDSQTGSTNSYAAVFAGGNIGIGDTTPTEATLVVGGDIYATINSTGSYTKALCWDDSGASLIQDCVGSVSADYMEMYAVEEGIETGDLVAPGTSYVRTKDQDRLARLEKTKTPYQSSAIGIVSDSTKAGDFNSIGYNIDQKDNPMPVALNGRVLVKVSGENGPIKQGDHLTSSSTPGFAMKATRPGSVVGKALENFPTSQGETSQGKILVFVTISWHDPTVFITDTGDINIVKSNVDQNDTKNINSLYSLALPNLTDLIEKIGIFSEIVSASIRTGIVEAQEITTNNLHAASATIGIVIADGIVLTTDNVSIAGVRFEEYISQKIEEVLAKNQQATVSPISKNEIVQAHFLSPLDENGQIHVRLDKDRFSLVNSKTATSSSLFTIDASGSARFANDITAQNASFSGQLRSFELFAKNAALDQASIAGTLRAGKIIANDIDGLEANIATLAAKYVDSKNSSASSSGNLSQETNLSTTNYEPITNNSLGIASFSAQLAYVEDFHSLFSRVDEGLIVLGATSLSDVSVAGQLSLGASFILADNSINVLNADLELQPLRQGGISFVGGLFLIDKEGNVKIGGKTEFANDVEIRGSLATSFLSPLPNTDLSIRLSSQSAIEQRLLVQNASGSSVLSLDQKGNLTASGSGIFDNILASALQIVRGAQADTSLTDTIASSSAGVATIIEGETERTVITPFVHEDSLIYLTPTSDTQGLTPYVARQVAEDPTLNKKGSFTIQIPERLDTDMSVNWWIIN